jgi:DNA-directed RNA polymerase specialized sigma24 family protein
MIENRNLSEELLEALKQQKQIAVAFARRCGIYDPEFTDVAMQEAAVRVLNDGIRTFDPKLGNAKQYVARILYLTCIWSLRTFYRGRPLPDGCEPGTTEFDPVDIVIRREEVSQASHAIDRLPPHLRAALRRSPERQRLSRAGSLIVRRTSTGNVRYFRAKDRFLAELVALRREKRPHRRRGK